MDHTAGGALTGKFLTLSQRIARIIVGIILIAIVATEVTLTTPWSVVLSIIAVYTLSTGLSGSDPLLKRLKHAYPQLPDHKLNVAAQLECTAIGAVFIAAGVLYRGSDSVLLRILPFLGIYPLLICAIKYDLLAYLMHSYRQSLATRNKE